MTIHWVTRPRKVTKGMGGEGQHLQRVIVIPAERVENYSTETRILIVKRTM